MYTILHSLTQSLRCPSYGGTGVLNKVLYGKAPPGGSNTYPLIYSFLPKWYPFHIPRAKSHPFFYTSRISQNYMISYNCHVSLGLSVILISCSRGGKIWHPFSHHFFHFAADFVNLSCTKMAIFPTLPYPNLPYPTPFRPGLPV